MTIPNEIDPRRLISAVEKCVNESIIRSFDSLYRFEVDGPMGGVFYIDFKSGEYLSISLTLHLRSVLDHHFTTALLFIHLSTKLSTALG